MPEKRPLVPFPTVTLVASKPVTVSVKVKVKVTVPSAMLTVLGSLSVIVTVGEIVSTVRVTVLLASPPSLLALPAASEKVAEATEITPFAVELVVGVKVAV